MYVGETNEVEFVRYSLESKSLESNLRRRLTAFGGVGLQVRKCL